MTRSRTTTAFRLLLAVIVLVAWPVGKSQAQDAESLQLGRIDLGDFPELQVDVSVPVSLTGDSINPADVTLVENGQSIPFAIEPTLNDGLEVVLLLDTSGSMNENGAIESAKLAAASFLDELPPEVAVGVVAFSDTPSLVSPLTTDRGALRASIAQLRAAGKTSLYDGIAFGSSLFSGSTDDRQFVLLSDGGDTASLATLEDALEITSQIRTNAIEIVTSESNSEALTEFASSGSGRLSSITDPSALGALYQEIARSLVNRFRLSFTSESNGLTDYTLTVGTIFGPLTASTSIDLPAGSPTTATSAPTTIAAPTESVAIGVADELDRPATAPSPVAPTGDGTSDDTSSVIPLLIGAAAVGVSLTVLLLILFTGDSRKLGRRQLGIVGRRRERGAKTPLGERVTAFADDAIDRSGRRTGLANALDVANVAMRPAEFVVVAVAGSVTVGVMLWWLVSALLGLLGMALTLVGARSYLRIRADRRRTAFENQLPDVLQLMTNALRSGFALPQALDAVANQAAEPACSEFQRVNFESRVGLDFGDSLRAMADRMQSTKFGWVVSALEINREVGGELAKVLSGLASTIRERQALDRQISTLTAEGRVSAYVLTVLPPIVGLGMAVINPEYFEPMRTSPGPQILFGCVVLLIVGWVWMRSMIKSEM